MKRLNNEHTSLNGELLTLPQTCEVSNLGMSTVRKIAQESGAVRKIGRSVRIKRAVFFDYIDSLNEKGATECE
jgi:hypothetical protein